MVEGVYKIQSDLGDGVDKGLNDFRNKKLFDFGWNDPGKVQIGTAVYQKSGDKWTSGSKTMDSATVQALIDKLRDLQADQAPRCGGRRAGGTRSYRDLQRRKARREGDDHEAGRQVLRAGARTSRPSTSSTTRLWTTCSRPRAA